MSDMNCGTCRACCEWSGQEDLAVKLTKVDLLNGNKGIATGHGTARMMMNDEGNCMQLGPDGCMNYNRRPEACKSFDCRVVLHQVLNDPKNVFARILAAAVTLEMMEALHAKEE